MALTIRTAGPRDAPRLHELHTTSVRQICAPHYTPEVVEGWLANRRPEGYLPPIGRGDIFVVEREASIVGFGEATPGVVVACYVDPTVVRQGVGSAIMRHALAIAARAHDGSIRVEATLNAAPFYARFGFGEVERSTVRRGQIEVPIVRMERA